LTSLSLHKDQCLFRFSHSLDVADPTLKLDFVTTFLLGD